MTLTFNPRTAYAHSWRYMPGIETAILRLRDDDGEFRAPAYNCKAVRADMSSGDWQQIGLGLALSVDTIVWCVWAAGSNAPKPELDSVLEVDGVRWIVRSVIDGRWGPEWVCGCVEATENTFNG